MIRLLTKTPCLLLVHFKTRYRKGPLGFILALLALSIAFPKNAFSGGSLSSSRRASEGPLSALCRNPMYDYQAMPDSNTRAPFLPLEESFDPPPINQLSREQRKEVYESSIRIALLVRDKICLNSLSSHLSLEQIEGCQEIEGDLVRCFEQVVISLNGGQNPLNFNKMTSLTFEEQASYKISIQGANDRDRKIANGISKKTFGAIFSSIGTVGLALTGSLAHDPWLKACSYGIASAIASVTGTLGSALIPVPENLDQFWKIVVKAAAGSALGIPASFLFYSSYQIGLEPGSSVNLVALNSLMGFVCSLGMTCGSILLFDQAVNWPVWLGVVTSAGVATIQIWHAVQNPHRYGQP